ncbi:MAG: hypothetical protein J0L97_09680 [Alphaproteobacteria bacterium]|nr:hypothetical protein [Alphaproteobacteria bacterium]
MMQDENPEQSGEENPFDRPYRTPHDPDGYPLTPPPVHENAPYWETPWKMIPIMEISSESILFWNDALNAMFKELGRPFFYDPWESFLEGSARFNNRELATYVAPRAIVAVHPLDFIKGLNFPMAPQKQTFPPHHKKDLVISLCTPRGREAVYLSYESMEDAPIREAFLLLSDATKGYTMLLKQDPENEALAKQQFFICEMALAFLVLGGVLDYVRDSRSPQDALLTLDDTVFHKFSIAVRFVPLLSDWLRGPIHEDVEFLRAKHGDDIMSKADDLELLKESAQAVADWAKTLSDMLGLRQQGRYY